MRLSVHVGALEEDLRTTHGVKQLLGLSAVGLELFAGHLQRVDLLEEREMGGVMRNSQRTILKK